MCKWRGVFLNIITYIITIAIVIIIAKIFVLPLKKIIKLILNSILGGALIYIINLIGASFGFHIGLNIFTAIFVRNFGSARSNFVSNN
ncbi:MAG: transcriptional regulator [Clostridiales bacterium]|nr:transcriptional regulator [Clostridiales bacterium]